MQYYRLMVEKGGEWHTVDLSPDERPEITFQINDIGELKDQNADHTQRITLPMTPSNARIFGHINSLNVLPDVAYDYMPCRLYHGVFSLMGRSAMLSILQANDDTLEAQIVGGVTDVADLLDGVDLATVDDTEISPTLPISPTIETPSNPNVIFPTLYIGAGDATTKTLDESTNAFRFPFPCIWLCRDDGETQYGLLPFLARQIGYTVEVQDANGFAPDMLIAPADRKRTFEDGEIIDETTYTYTEPTGLYLELSPFFKSENNTVREGYGWSYMPSEVEVVVTSKLDLASFSDVPDIKPMRNQYSIYVNGTKVKDVDVGDLNDRPGIREHSEIIEAKPNDIISVRDIYSYSATENPEKYYVNMKTGSTISITRRVKTDIDYAFAGTVMPICSNLKWKSAADAFKAVCQLLGLIMTVDNDAKKITLTNMSRLLQAKDKARDWSGKLIRGGIAREFTVEGYGQENTISLKADRDDFTDSGTLTCGNRTLEQRKELFTVDFESGTQKAADGGRDKTALLKFYGKDEDGTQTYQALNAPHAIERNSDSDYAHITMKDISGKQYSVIQNMLTRPLTVRADFLLTDLDVADFDHFTPVYLRQFGAYFYVNKISNFVAGEVTEVELIKLNT